MNGGTLSRKIGEMMDIQLNELSKKEFDPALINEITPDTGYSIWTKKDPFGRAYFGVGNFCGMDRSINEDTDLSWLEWDGNEVNISNNDKMLLFEKTIGIMKGWIDQLVESYPDDSFVVFASFDDGNALVEECERNMSFTLRFWKKREGSGLDENMEYFPKQKGWINVNIIAMTCMCVDVFDDTGEIRPGGEALNFAAIASKYNHISVDLLGAIGDDDYGKAILKSIENKPINKEFIHIISGSATANHRIYLTEKGDRYFKDDSWNGGIHDTYLLSDSDKNRIASADIIFITFDSPNFDDVLELRKSCRFQLAVDFNVLRDFKKIETIVPYINFFFISGEKSILLQFQKWSERYDNIFNITLAENGSVTYYMGKEYRVDAVPVNKYLRDCDIINAMNEGSRVASKTLSHIGGF